MLRFKGLIAGSFRLGLLAVLAALCLAAHTGSAFSETRTLKLYYVHTKERAEVTYKRNGKYLSEGLKKANYMLRDWRRNEPTKMDPKTLDILWQIYKSSGSRDYIHVVSAYRSPATNAMLRRTRGGQAEKSQHMLGKAIDFYLPDVKLSKLRAIAFKIQGGGVGFYPKSGSPFVHVDSGNVRAWPRMSRNELLALFPDGKTVHLPADGKPLPGYQAALAAYKSSKGAGSTIVVDDTTSSKKPTLFAALFGGGADETDDEADVSIVAASVPEKPAVAVAAAKPAKPQAVDIAALQPAAMDGGPDVTGSGVVASIQPSQNQPAAALEAISEVAPEFTTLPGRDAPVPSSAPRAVEAPAAQEVMVAAVEPIDPVAVKAAEALAEAEIAAIDATNTNLPADGPVPTPRPVLSADASETELPAVNVAAIDPDLQPSIDPNTDPNTGNSNLRASFAPTPQSAPTRDEVGELAAEQMAADNELQLEEGAVEMAALPDQGPIPELRVDTLSATPVVESKPKPVSNSGIGANLKTGVKTTGKTAKPVLSAKVRKNASPVLELSPAVNPDRFGSGKKTTVALNELQVKSSSKSPRILPDGSTLVSSGRIAP